MKQRVGESESYMKRRVKLGLDIIWDVLRWEHEIKLVVGGEGLDELGGHSF